MRDARPAPWTPGTTGICQECGQEIYKDGATVWRHKETRSPFCKETTR